jgi:hypothetical protein
MAWIEAAPHLAIEAADKEGGGGGAGGERGHRPTGERRGRLERGPRMPNAGNDVVEPHFAVGAKDSSTLTS